MHMRGSVILIAVCLGIAIEAHGQRMVDRIISEHIRIIVPAEREWMGRDVISEIERCWRFVNGMINEKLPRQIIITVSWTEKANHISLDESSVIIGMDQPAADPNPRQFILRAAAKGMARLGLLELSRGAYQLEEAQFIIEGMSEMIMREWERNTRSLVGAWMIAYYLDKMHQLSFAVQGSWATFSKGRHTFCTAAPGITFLAAIREQQNRERVLKFLDALKHGGFQEAMETSFRTSMGSLEGAWLEKVRAYDATETYTATTDDEAPVLRQTVTIPPEARPGSTIQILLTLTDKASNLLPDAVFVQDEASGQVFQGSAPSEKAAGNVVVRMPIEAGRQPGTCNYVITAVDEAGNIRHWKQSYPVIP